MAEHEGWQVTGDAAEVYEQCFSRPFLATGHL